MKLWADFFDYVLPDLPACPHEVATAKIHKACIDFMAASSIMVADHAPVNTVAGTPTYAFAPATGLAVTQVHTGWFDGAELEPASEDKLRQVYPDWPTAEGAPRFILSETPLSFRVVPKPDAASAGTGRITLRVVLQPARDATGIDDWVFNKWVEAIAAKAKADLMAMPAKPWTNPAMSVYYESVYQRELGDAVREVNRGMGRAQTRVQMRPAA